MLQLGRHKRRSIIRIFMEVLVLALFAGAGLVFLVSMIVSTTNAEADLRARADAKMIELREVLKTSLWNFDEREAAVIGKAYMENDFIASITITDANGGVVFGASKKDDAALFFCEGAIEFNGQSVGTVRFAVSAHYLAALQSHFLWSYFVTVSVLMLIILAIAGAALGAILRKSFRDFGNFVESYSAGDYKAFDHGNTPVEFDSLVGELKRMNAAVMSHMERVISSEARLDGFFANAPVGMAILDDRMRYLKVNGLLADWGGIEPEEKIGKSLGTTLPAFRNPCAADLSRSVHDRPTVRDLELTTAVPSRPDRETIWLVSKFPIEDASGKAASFGVIVTDVTERKKAEEALAQLNRQLEQRVDERTQELREAYLFNEQVIANSPVGISLYDTTGQCVMANDAVAEMIGATREQVLAQNWRQIKSWENNGLKAAAELALAEGVRKRLEVGLVSTFGKSVHLDCYFVPIRRDGQLNLMFVASDFSERKRAEEKLKSLQSELIRNERLAVLGQLTGMVAHELRNPLGALVNSASAIRYKCDEAGLDLTPALDRIDRSVKRCERIITDLLDFAGRRGMRLETRKLDNWLSAVLAEQAIPDGITVSTDFGTGGEGFRFDPESLRRALVNLVDNACQAMTAGNGQAAAVAEGELRICSRVSGERVEIEVVDTGPGIPEDVLPRVLEPLFSTKSFGTGLGMPTVQRIMEEHGGGLELSSEVGRGTRVTLWLQREAANDDGQDDGLKLIS